MAGRISPRVAPAPQVAPEPEPAPVLPAVGSVDPAGACARSVALLRRLEDLQREVATVSAERRALLVTAHDAGWTWDRIASAVGMHRVSLMRLVREREPSSS